LTILLVVDMFKYIMYNISIKTIMSKTHRSWNSSYKI